MSVPVPLEELAEALDRRSNLAYLLTVDDDGRAHCVAATVAWAGVELIIPAGTSSLRNAEARGHVVLLSPPVHGLATTSDDHEAYSLIVDAELTTTSHGDGPNESTVAVRPTHAVLHRPAAKSEGGPANGCLHDCVHVLDDG